MANLAVKLVRTFGLTIFVLVLAFSASAQTIGTSLNWDIGCNGFTNVGGVAPNDSGEIYIIRATDGAGNTIFGPVTDASIVGTRIFSEPGTLFEWTQAPTTNPLTITISTPRGANQVSTVIYTASGNCDGLGSIVPTELNTQTGIAPVFEVGAGQRDNSILQTSPSTGLNQNPPRPDNRQSLRNTGIGYLIVDSFTVNMRSGDGPQYTVVGQVEGGTELIPVGQNATGSWWFVEVDGVRGWVNNTLVVIRGDVSDTPVIEPQGEILPPRLYVYRDQVLRLAPVDGSAVVCNISGDLEYIIAGQTADGEWLALALQCGDQPIIGWISSAAGAIRNSGDLPIRVIDG